MEFFKSFYCGSLPVHTAILEQHKGAELFVDRIHNSGHLSWDRVGIPLDDIL
jgi:hypothetical protein